MRSGVLALLVSCLILASIVHFLVLDISHAEDGICYYSNAKLVLSSVLGVKKF